MVSSIDPCTFISFLLSVHLDRLFEVVRLFVICAWRLSCGELYGIIRTVPYCSVYSRVQLLYTEYHLMLTSSDLG